MNGVLFDEIIAFADIRKVKGGGLIKNHMVVRGPFLSNSCPVGFLGEVSHNNRLRCGAGVYFTR